MGSVALSKVVFRVAGIYGVIAIVPGFFLEKILNSRFPPALTHPEYFYGFFGLALAWQIAFFIIAADPIGLRAIIPAAVVEKLAYTISCAVLMFAGRLAPLFGATAAIDLVFAILFLIVYVRLNNASPRRALF